MQRQLSSGDRNLLILAGLLIMILGGLAALVSPGGEGQVPGMASSFSTADGGAKAAYLLLEEMGWHVERWTESPQELPGVELDAFSSLTPHAAEKTILILAQPAIAAAQEEKLDLRNFVRRGGRVLIAGGLPSLLLPKGSLKPASFSASMTELYASEIPSPLTMGAPQIQMAASTRWPRLQSGQMGYYGDSNGAVVASFVIGKGKVVWWADAGPLTNSRISLASNLELFLNSVGARKDSRILWDEYYHGYRAGLWSYLGRTPLPWSLIQVAVLMAAALATFGRRRGPLRGLERVSRLSPLEFVETLGDLYQQKGSASEALRIVYLRFRFLLLTRLGLPAGTPLKKIQEALRDRLGWTAPGFPETLARSELGVKNSSLTAGQALDLIQELHDGSRRLGFGEWPLQGS